MRLLRIASVLLLLLASTLLVAQEKRVYFSISTDSTFRPGEKPSVRLYAHNVDSLEFRVYRVRDPKTFFERMSDVHHFGPEHSPKEDVDAKTAIERFHDWKHSMWVRFRNFIRAQFSADSREEIRERHSNTAVTRHGAVSEFARVPLLNASQLVARWKVRLPSALVSESSNLPMDSLDAGAYLVEVTDGNYKAYTVLLVSKMAIITKTYPGHLLVFAADRKSGKPIANVALMLWRNKKVAAQLKTDGEGLAETTVADDASANPAQDGYGTNATWILAEHDGDVALVAPYYSEFSLSSDPSSDWLGYVYTDRPVYRPGHTVDFKAVIRKRNGDAIGLPAEHEARVEITDAENAVVLRKQFPLSPLGTLHGSFDVPKNATLGSYSIQVSTGKGSASGSFDVEEYKKPEYWVKVTPATPRVQEGDNIQATIEARYFFGEPVANATVKYVVHTSRHYYWDEDQMGDDIDDGNDGADFGDYGGDQTQEHEGKLDADGRLVVSLPTQSDDNKSDVDYRIEARVTDAANREVAGHNGVLATYGSYRLEVRAQSYIYRSTDSVALTINAADYDAHPRQVPVKIELVNRHSPQKEQVLYTSQAQTGTDGSAHVNIPLSASGSVTVRVTSKTPEGREVMSETWLWVVGQDTDWYSGDRQVQLVADKPSYKVGEVAHIVVMDPVPDATLLVTAEGRTIISRQVVPTKSKQTTVDVPVTREGQPNFFVNVLFVSDNKMYQGKKSLKVPTTDERLNIEITPSKAQFIPGEKAEYIVTAKDSKGKPVQAELSFGVVDDAIYGVRPDTSGDIVNAFYQKRWGEVMTNHSLDFHFDGEAGKKSIELAKAFRAPRRSALAQVKSGDLVQPKVRKAFPDTAYWAPDVHTDATGRATVTLSFPDSLTTWRTTVRAITADTKGGSQLNRVIVRKNIILRLAVPRFFRPGDDVTVSTIVHNYLDSTKEAKISLQADGISLLDGGVRDATITNRGEVKLDWHLKALPGKEVKLVAKALTNEESDAMELTLPIVPVGVKKSISRSGVGSICPFVASTACRTDAAALSWRFWQCVLSQRSKWSSLWRSRDALPYERATTAIAFSDSDYDHRQSGASDSERRHPCTRAVGVGSECCQWFTAAHRDFK